MIINPLKAYALAAQAERANEALAGEEFFGVPNLDIKVRAVLYRLKVAARVIDRADADLAAANAKIARMTGGLKQNAKAS